jgi:dTDP-4-dehydrorhamnose 3,5-epimerase
MTTGRKDDAHVTADWVFERPDAIDGAVLREVRHVVTHNGVTTETFRVDWGVVGGTVKQILHVELRPGALSAWHLHRDRFDHLMVVGGHLKVVLHDPREDSPSQGRTEVFLLSDKRPQLLVIPPGVWHGVQNLDPAHHGRFLNYFDEMYDYADPDEWRLPPDTDEIPYRF